MNRCEDCAHPILRVTTYQRRTRCDCGLLLCTWCHATHTEMSEFGLGCREPTLTYQSTTEEEIRATRRRQERIVEQMRAHND